MAVVVHGQCNDGDGYVGSSDGRGAGCGVSQSVSDGSGEGDLVDDGW